MDDANFCRICGSPRAIALAPRPIQEPVKQPSPEKTHILKIEEEVPRAKLVEKVEIQKQPMSENKSVNMGQSRKMYKGGSFLSDYSANNSLVRSAPKEDLENVD